MRQRGMTDAIDSFTFIPTEDGLLCGNEVLTSPQQCSQVLNCSLTFSTCDTTSKRETLIPVSNGAREVRERGSEGGLYFGKSAKTDDTNNDNLNPSEPPFICFAFIL